MWSLTGISTTVFIRRRIEILDPLTALVKAAKLSDADNVLNVVAELRTRIGVKHVHHAAVVQRKRSRPPNFYQFARFCEVVAVRLLINSEVRHTSTSKIYRELGQELAHKAPPPPIAHDGKPSTPHRR